MDTPFEKVKRRLPAVGIVELETGERQTNKPLPDVENQETCRARSYLSRPDRVGLSTSIFVRRPVAVASQGPIPQPLSIRYSPSCRSRILQSVQRAANLFSREFLAAQAFRRSDRSPSGNRGDLFGLHR